MDSETSAASLSALPRVQRNGSEVFHTAGAELGFNLLSFWKWSASDLVSNTLRGLLAEYLVAQAVAAAKGVRGKAYACRSQPRHQDGVSLKGVLGSVVPLVHDLCAAAADLGGTLTLEERTWVLLRLVVLSALLISGAWLFWLMPLGWVALGVLLIAGVACPIADCHPRDGARHAAGLAAAGNGAGLPAELADGLALCHLRATAPASSPLAGH